MKSESQDLQIFRYYNYPSDDEKAGKLPWRVIPEISGAGHFFDLGSHQLDYLDFLFGPVLKVSSLAVNQAHNYSAEDFVSAQLPFQGQYSRYGNLEFQCIA